MRTAPAAVAAIIRLLRRRPILGPCLLLMFVALTGAVLAAGGSSAVRLPKPRASERVALPPSACPFQTPEEWQKFLEENADNPKWVETCEDSTCDGEYYAHVKNEIQRTFEICRSFIESHDQIDRCTANYRKFVPSWMRMHDTDSYGFIADNHTYLSQQTAPDKPRGMMDPPKVILAALPNRTKVEEAARKAGLKYLTHDSAIDGIRTFVLYSDPDGKFDQWMLLNLKQGDSAVNKNTPLSVLAVQKKDADGHTLPKVRLHFRDYNFSHATAGDYKLVLNEDSNGKCYSCHANGARQLIARHTPVLEGKPTRGEDGFDEEGRNVPKDFAFNRLMEFNRRIRSYGNPDWDGMVIPENHGPALGEAQGCIDCHNGSSRGILTVSTSISQLEKKMFYELSMPYDTNLPRLLERSQMKNPALSPEETEMLRQAMLAHKRLTLEFEASRLPALKEWLLETPCRS